MRSHLRTEAKTRAKSEKGTERFTSAEPPDEELEPDDQFQETFARLIRDVQKKRIKRDNSFSYEFPDVEQMSDFGANKEESWKRFSVTLDAGKSLYTYRVDTVDQAAKRLLSQREPKTRGEAEGAEPNERRAPVRSAESTLENTETLTLSEPNHTFIDALFYRITLNFDEGGYRGLLVTTLTLDDRLAYTLVGDETRSSTAALLPSEDFRVELEETATELLANHVCPQFAAFRAQFGELSAEQFDLKLESTRIQLPKEEFLADDDLADVEHTIVDQIRTTQVDMLVEAAPEPAYEFREEKLEFGSEAKALLDDNCVLGELPDVSAFGQLTDFNVWDVTDPRAMRGRAQRRPARVVGKKAPTMQHVERVQRLRAAFAAELSAADREPPPRRAAPVVAAAQLYLKRTSLFDLDFGFFFIRGGRIPRAATAETANAVAEPSEERQYEMICVEDEAPPSKARLVGAQKRVKVNEVKEKLRQLCLGDASVSLARVCAALVEDEPECASLRHQSIFLILLHMASEQGFELESRNGDVLITKPSIL